jgi:hypothetical protein
MNNYKYNWKSSKVPKWRYQDAELEDMYRAWVKEQEKKDKDYQADIQEHLEHLKHINDVVQMQDQEKLLRGEAPPDSINNEGGEKDDHYHKME